MFSSIQTEGTTPAQHGLAPALAVFLSFCLFEFTLEVQNLIKEGCLC